MLHEGTIALSQVESNGLRIDMGYLRKTQEELTVRCEEMEKELRHSKEWRLWRKRFGQEAKFGSSDQLAVVMYDEMGYEPTEFTETGKPKTDEAALSKLKSPFVASYLRWKKLGNANNTFLRGIEREVCDGFLHPNYNLNIAITFRSSSDNPNFQNYPIRDPEIGQLIRRCFIPRKGNVLTENDFKGVEVGVTACYNLDPVLIDYIKDPTKDMHRDMAAELYFLRPDQVTKIPRYLAKNNFVFPQFYGDWYKNSTVGLWEGIESNNVLGPDGKSLYVHLAKNGIKSRGNCIYEEEAVKGTYEYHVMKVERDFWKRRFKVYDKWKHTQFSEYQKNGYFDSHTGFRYEGVFNKKQTSNYPIQGSAFHCLLWTLIKNQKLNNKNRVGRLTVGQIHDSLISDVPERELADHLEQINYVVSVLLPKHWEWIIVPLQIETEIVGKGKTWYDKKEVKPSKDGYEFMGKKYSIEDLLETLKN